MSKKINQIISEIIKIPGSTQIPKSEQQNFNPPHIASRHYGYGANITAKKIWDGGYEDDETNENKIDKIKPIINEDGLLDDVSENDSEELWGSSNVHGFEAIAWYKSFHISNFWGIYISYSGLLRYAKKFQSVVSDEKISLELAWYGIMAHESVHYGVDVACARVEILARTPIYLPGKINANGNDGYSVDEERLAEGALLRYFKSKKKSSNLPKINSIESIYDIAIRNSTRLPKGYCDGVQASTMASFKYYADKYISDLVGFSLNNQNAGLFEQLELASLMPLRKEYGAYIPGYIDWSECPIYIVDDHQYTGIKGGSLSFLTHISFIRESQKFIKKISPQYLNSWGTTKRKLADPVMNKNSSNLDLKRWRQEDDKANRTIAWSVRVGGKSANMRAHIDEYQETGRWVADRFGNADEMGHHKSR